MTAAVSVRVRGVLGREHYVLHTPNRRLRAVIYFGRGVIDASRGRLGGGIIAEAAPGDDLVGRLPPGSEVWLARAFIMRKRGSASARSGGLTAFVDAHSRNEWLQKRMANWRRELCATSIEPLTTQEIEHETD